MTKRRPLVLDALGQFEELPITDSVAGSLTISSKVITVATAANSGCDFSSIQAAVDSATGTFFNPSIILIHPGTYDEDVLVSNGAAIYFIGMNKTTCRVKSFAQSSATTNPVSLSNLTFYGYRTDNKSTINLTGSSTGAIYVNNVDVDLSNSFLNLPDGYTALRVGGSSLVSIENCHIRVTSENNAAPTRTYYGFLVNQTNAVKNCSLEFGSKVNDICYAFNILWTNTSFINCSVNTLARTSYLPNSYPLGTIIPVRNIDTSTPVNPTFIGGNLQYQSQGTAIGPTKLTSGTTLPASGIQGELFFRNNGLIYGYSGSSWHQMLVPRGTAFPTSPLTGERFTRSDRNIEYFYDGTRWLSTQLYLLSMAYSPQVPTLPLTTNQGSVMRVSSPIDSGSIYLEKFIFEAYTAATFGASNNWNIQLTRIDDTGANPQIGTNINTWVTGRSANIRYPNTLVINSEFTLSQARTFGVGCTNNNGGPLGIDPGILQYRLVG